jgi:hypothetical protein
VPQPQPGTHFCQRTARKTIGYPEIAVQFQPL